MFKRIFLFVMTNILVMMTIGIIFAVTGVNRYIGMDGSLNLVTLFGFCLVIGFTGSFISLLMSRAMAKWSMGVKVIDPNMPKNDAEQWVMDIVYFYARKAGMKVMPEVGIYDSPEVNAFATGPSKSKSLVALSSGLLIRLDKESIEGVVAHEISHVVNGDMVTMTLLQGVMNTFVEFFSRIIGWAASRFMSGDEDEPNMVAYYITYFVFQILFGILASLVVFKFSRYREYRADKGGAELASPKYMIAALESLLRLKELPYDTNTAVATFKISGKKGLLGLMSSHPDLEDRIARLKEML